MPTTKPSFELDPLRVLDAVPVPNGAVRREQRDGKLVLWVPLTARWWMQAPFSWLFPFRKERGIELDGLGGEVFLECDGETPLERIIERFAARHRLRFHEARLSVVAFLNALVERKLVVLRVPEGAVVARSKPRRASSKKAVGRSGRPA